MVDNQDQKIADLKERMDSMFSFASQVPYKTNHLLPVIQGSKSLIGMDLNHPPRNLLKWLDNYIKDFVPNFNPPSLPDQNSLPETITYTHLRKLILHKKENEANIYLTHLLQVADPRHIAEFLMELGVKKSPGSILFCWSTFRSIQFFGEQNGYPLLYHCLGKLLEIEEDGKNKTKLVMEKFALYCHQFQIRSTSMVRKNKIIPQLDKMIQTIKRELNKTATPAILSTLGNIIRTEGKQGIISYLAILKMEDISTDLILLLDALRSSLKFSDNREDPFLLGIFDNHRAYECAE